jgi:hypothetical protein
MRPLFVAGVVKVAAGLAAVWWISESVQLPARALPTLYYVILLLVFGLSGTVLYLGGSRDTRARSLGVVLLLFGSLFTERLVPRAQPSAPFGIDVVLGTVAKLHLMALAPYALWRFAWTFPLTQAALVPSWVQGVLSRLAFITGAVLAFGTIILESLPGDVPSSVVAWVSPDEDRAWFWQAVSILTLPSLALLVLKHRTAAASERRRLAWVVFGIVVGTAPMLLHVLLAVTFDWYANWSAEPARSRLIGIVLTAFSIGIPIATAYAVVMQHVLDVRFVVRRAVQYLLARYTVMTLMFGFAVVIAAIAYYNRNRPLAEILSESPLVVAGVVLGGAVLLWRRQLLDAIDRRFFREQYDAKRILVDLVDSSQKAQTTQDIVRLITGEVDRALHLERIALLLFDRHNNRLNDPEGHVRSVNADGALGSLIGASHTPFDVDLSSDGSLLNRLPEAEREWLADTGARLIVPLFSVADRPLGVLALGEKRSELPFTPEDRKLMVAVAASAAATLEQKLRHESPNPDLPSHSGMLAARQCVVCGRVQDRQLSACRACGNSVRDALLPTVLAGKFELDRQMGAGGMGVVYRARDLNLHRFVALKVLPRIEPQAASRLRREARVMASMQHPNLAVVHDLESWRGSPVLVLEYLSGGTLAQRLRFESLPIAEVVSLGNCIGGVLHHLHRAGYLHRDVKPSNIGFADHGVAKLMDFGLVRLLVRLSEFTDISHATTIDASGGLSTDVTFESGRHKLVGTPAYLPPEALTTGMLNPSLDLWSLAVTLYEALTRRNPFSAPTVPETLNLVAKASVPSVKLARPDCPDGLADFFAMALAADVTMRPQSAADFVDRINASVASSVTVAP